MTAEVKKRQSEIEPYWSPERSAALARMEAEAVERIEVIPVMDGIAIEISEERRQNFEDRFGITLEDYAEVFKSVGLIFGAMFGGKKK